MILCGFPKVFLCESLFNMNFLLKLSWKKIGIFLLPTLDAIIKDWHYIIQAVFTWNLEFDSFSALADGTIVTYLPTVIMNIFIEVTEKDDMLSVIQRMLILLPQLSDIRYQLRLNAFRQLMSFSKNFRICR